MDYKTENKYKVYFKDGTSFESSGDSNSLNKSTVENEFKWVSFHITKEVASMGKSLNDISRIEYNLNFLDPTV